MIELTKLMQIRTTEMALTTDCLISIMTPVQMRHLIMLMKAIARRDPWAAIENIIPMMEQ